MVMSHFRYKLANGLPGNSLSTEASIGKKNRIKGDIVQLANLGRGALPAGVLVAKGAHSAVEKFLEKGHLSTADLSKRDAMGCSCLHRAARTGVPEAVCTIVKLGHFEEDDFVAVDTDGWSVLHHAASAGSGPCVEVLLQLCHLPQEALALPDSWGRTPVHIAAEADSMEVIQVLAKHQAPLHMTMGRPVLQDGTITLVQPREMYGMTTGKSKGNISEFSRSRTAGAMTHVKSLGASSQAEGEDSEDEEFFTLGRVTRVFGDDQVTIKHQNLGLKMFWGRPPPARQTVPVTLRPSSTSSKAGAQPPRSICDSIDETDLSSILRDLCFWQSYVSTVAELRNKITGAVWYPLILLKLAESIGVLSGAPNSGKSSLVVALAESLGLTKAKLHPETLALREERSGFREGCVELERCTFSPTPIVLAERRAKFGAVQALIEVAWQPFLEAVAAAASAVYEDDLERNYQLILEVDPPPCSISGEPSSAPAAEDDDKMEKAEKKRERAKDKGSGKGKAMRRPAASCEAAKPETTRGRKRNVSPKAKASPKRKGRKTEKKPEESAPEPAGETMTEKDKRRLRARTAFAKLQDEKIPGLELPKDLGNRISFTVKSPDGVGSSVGVILASDSFYVSKAVEYDKWPTDCTHLKVLRSQADLTHMPQAGRIGWTFSQVLHIADFVGEALESEQTRDRLADLFSFGYWQAVDYEMDGCCHDLLGNIGFLFAVRQVLRIKEGGLGYWGLPCNSFSFMARSLHQRTGGKDLRLSAAYPKDYGREVVFISTEKNLDGWEGVPSNVNELPPSLETSTNAGNAPDGDDGRPSLRNLETQTTIPLGHVEDGELDDAMNAKYNKPLWRCLFESLVGKEVEIDRLVKPTSIWLDIRNDRGDIDVIDPEMAGACSKAVDFKTMLCKKELDLKGIERDHQIARTKIDAAADAMIQQQKEKVEKMGTTDVENSPLFQVNKNNIIVWKGNKQQVLEKAYQCAVDEVRRAQKDLEKHVEYMIEFAYAKWANHMQMEPDVGIDPELFGELEAIMQLLRKRKNRTLAAQGVWMIIRKSVVTTSTETVETETTVVHGDRKETQDEYDKRMAINAKMRFHRSLASC
eukprot:s2165_g8.t1